MTGQRERHWKPCVREGCPHEALTAASRALCVTCRGGRDVLVPQAPYQESPAQIEARFQAALAVIKARPRGEPEVRWTSALSGLYGRGL